MTKQKKECDYQILTSYNSSSGGTNNRELHEIVNARFHTVSRHNSLKSARKKLKSMCEK